MNKLTQEEKDLIIRTINLSFNTYTGMNIDEFDDETIIESVKKQIDNEEKFKLIEKYLNMLKSIIDKLTSK